MINVAHNRGLPIRECMIATPFYPIGTKLVIHSAKYKQWALCYVYDVPQPEHWDRIVAKKIYVEFDWYTARRMCDLRYVGEKPPRDCPVHIYEIIPRAVKGEEKEKSKL